MAIFTANAPFAFDIIDVVAKVSTLINPSTIQLRDTAAGAGAALSDALVSTTTGVKRNATATTSSAVARNGTLILRRSDSGVAGSIDIVILRTA